MSTLPPRPDFLPNRPDFARDRSCPPMHPFGGRSDDIFSPQPRASGSPKKKFRYNPNYSQPPAQPLEQIQPQPNYLPANFSQFTPHFAHRYDHQSSFSIDQPTPIAPPPPFLQITMESVTHPFRPLQTPFFPPGLSIQPGLLGQGAFPLFADTHFPQEFGNNLPPFPPAASGPTTLPVHVYHPSLTPIVEASPYLDSPTSITNTHLRQNSHPQPYFTQSTATDSLGLGLPIPSPLPPFMGQFGSDGAFQDAAAGLSTELTPQLSHTHSSSTASTPSTPQSDVDISIDAARRRSTSIQMLALSPLDNVDDVVEVLIPTNAAGAVQGFPVHHRLLSHFSPAFKAHLENVIAAEEVEQKQKVKMMEVKVFNYQDELAFYPRVEAGPCDYEDYSEYAYSDMYPAEDSVITVPVRVALPQAILQPRKVFLPADVGVVSPKTFAALMSWLYLGEEFVRDVKAVSMIELWVLVDKLGMKTCQNDCIVGIEKERQERNVVEVGMMEWAWTATKDQIKVKTSTKPEKVEEDVGRSEHDKSMAGQGTGIQETVDRHACPLRNLLVDQCAWFLDETWLDGVGETGTRNEDVLGMRVLVDCKSLVIDCFGSCSNKTCFSGCSTSNTQSGGRYQSPRPGRATTYREEKGYKILGIGGVIAAGRAVTE